MSLHQISHDTTTPQNALTNHKMRKWRKIKWKESNGKKKQNTQQIVLKHYIKDQVKNQILHGIKFYLFLPML